ncbi:MAG: NADH:ubiquinone oxidoreductase subunit N, partial [Rhodocyclaceae bacterium]|nr:NADH:ubiquinone oxidoreductase subunit N [Rhodocyclaceae bacterium]
MNFAIPNFLPAAAEIFVAVMVLLSLLLTTFVRERQSARALGYGLAQISLLGACVIVVVVMPSQAVL